ncbi:MULTISPECIES: Holliday junction resolvase RuvX [unclassified Moraxella]|uniref:Holliday junction resolvase RuvX n=1 Tax=unclassified Moraxella TaxID=2685852 RepID=UPI003AF7BAFB
MSDNNGHSPVKASVEIPVKTAIQPPVKTPVKTIMGLDFGVAKMGIALGNTLTQTATPLMQFPMSNGVPDWQKLLALIAEWQVNSIVVGIPTNMDGTASEMGNRAKKFVRRLNHQLEMAHIPCPIIMADERLTSREAKNLAWEYGLIKSEKEPIDSIASAILLGSWLRENY